MKTSNPIFGPGAMRRAFEATDGQVMTVNGAVNKTFILLAILLGSAVWLWQKAMSQMAPGVTTTYNQVLTLVGPYVLIGSIAGLILAIAAVFKPTWIKTIAPLYALCQGLALSGISVIFELRYPGIVLNAVALTFATLFCLLTAYRTGMIRATEKFKAGIFAATGAIMVVYLINFVMSFFHTQIPLIWESGMVGIGFSLFVVVIAALNLVLDFDFIEKGAEMGAPQYMEWYGAFGLMVTLVWLYVEFLRLLSKLRSRN